jgi:HAD superfamily hydrolase (TIGR01549 family)
LTLHIEAILLDLDDTLLGNDINGFINNYLPLLANFVSPHIDPSIFVDELMIGTQAMVDNTDPVLTNEEVFWSVFYQRTGLDRATFKPTVDEFYGKEFGKLRPLTHRVPEATRVIEYCIKQGFHVVIATNPLFPLAAIEQRLDWAGIPVTEFRYDLVTSYENMHASKPRSEYYQEILTKVGATPELAIMVGDDWSNDIEGASQAGLYSFWINLLEDGSTNNLPGLVRSGNLGEFYRMLTEGDIQIAE